MIGRTPVAGPIGRLVDLFSKLPGIGEKTATRLAFHILKGSDEYPRELAKCLVDVKESIRPCPRCFSLTDVAPCAICADPHRDPQQLCVVAGTSDVMAIERTGSFSGCYHVLGGLLSPLDGVGPDKLHIRELLERVDSSASPEIILALNPSVDGEATTHYLARLLKVKGVEVSRIASGIPMGGDLEWIDTHTLVRSLQDRRQVM